MKHRINLFTLLFIGLVVLSSCKSDKETFRVKGVFTSADGKTIYFEKRDLAGIQLVDSTKLNEKGTFSFSVSAPKNPEFYQLRINGQSVVFASDSNRILNVTGDAANLAATFSIENSPVNDRIEQITEQQQIVSRRMSELTTAHRAASMNDVEYLAELDSVLDVYKSFATRMILENPGSAAAYYALFQKVDNYLIFDPYDRKDYGMFGAVATSWSNLYAETPRAKHLYDFTMSALKSRREQERQAAMLENLHIEERAQMPDIVLPQVDGTTVALSSLKGKVVLLDFSVYKSDFSPQHNLEINRLYRQMSNKGFEVYQISFDSDEHFWKNAAVNVPWIAVRDANSVYSALLGSYNVRNLPTAFILNRTGDVVTRIEDYTKLQAELSKVL